VVATLRSTSPSAPRLAWAFLAIGIGHGHLSGNIMPPSSWRRNGTRWASPKEDRQAFAEDGSIEGAEASQITKRPLLRRTLIAATLPAALAPLVILRDLGPEPKGSLRTTVVEEGHPAARSTGRTSRSRPRTSTPRAA